jgi:catechol 2,3-dioxygenase-like lactoylglutathione lyase family enzyme
VDGPALSPLDTIAFVGVSSLARARAFYGGVLELPVEDDLPYALVLRAGGTRLRVTAVGQVVAAPYTVLGWAVADIAATVDRLTTRGVDFRRFGQLDQDERGVWHAPGGARVAWFADPDGNLLSLTQPAE